MPLVTWDMTYSVKVQACDEQHQQLFALINDLYDAMVARQGDQVTKQIVEDLMELSKLHFRTEESLLEKTAYPELEAHRAHHREFLKRVEQFQRDQANGKALEPRFVANRFMMWWTRHARQIDQKYSNHLNACGVF
jgi:hemerythrin